MADEETPLPETSACPRCGGERFLAEGSNQVLLFRRGSAVTSALHNHSRVNALVCRACGYTELYARRPDLLRPA